MQNNKFKPYTIAVKNKIMKTNLISTLGTQYENKRSLKFKFINLKLIAYNCLNLSFIYEIL